ncbi:MAG TPA: ABC transporter permease [Candidatus Angelobacter sp.]|nr:ABC transporter permease [Candidatus Angelobacter sp.]
MTWLTRILSRRRELNNLSEEMAEHLQEKVEELVAGGMSQAEAENAARREFGNFLLIEERGREVWQWKTLEAILRDTKYALRQLRRNPGFSLAVLLTLTLAIGANTAVFSVVNGLMLRPLPYPEANRLAAVMRHRGKVADKSFFDEDEAVDGETLKLIGDNVPTVQAASYSFASSGVNLQTETAVRYIQNQRVSAGYFEVLGIRPILGRTFTSEEDRPHGPKAVLLSFELWRSTFGSDRNILGKVIALKGEPQVVVGVLPANTHVNAPADLWTPLQPSPTGEGGGENYHVVARLKEGSTWDQVNAQLAVLKPPSFIQFAKDNPEKEEFLVSHPLQQALASQAHTPMVILMAAVGFILLIASANLAGLMLVRVMRRSGELATRLALGATPASILRQLMMEPLILALAGGVAGVAMAEAGMKLLTSLLPDSMMPVGGLSIDGTVLMFALAASICACLLIGILPALEIRKVELRPSMNFLARGNADATRQRTRQALTAAEVMLTVVLLSGSGLLIRTLVHLQTLPPGFDATNVMTAQLSLDDARYHNAPAFQRLLQQSQGAMKRIPGVESAAVGLSLPFERGLNDGFSMVEGPDAGKSYMSSSVYVTPEYFRVLRIPLLAGRAFTDGDTATSEPVAIVNESFAKRFFHTTDVVGRHIRLGKPTAVIVGVVGDVTKQPGLFQTAPLSTEITYYFPAAQVPGPFLGLLHVWFQPSWVVRTQGPVNGLTEAMQKAMAEADPSLPFAGFHRLDELQAEALRKQRFEVLLLSALAGLALLLSLVGIYGLVSNMVVQRTREIGIRMALGATVRRAMVEIGVSGMIAVGLGLAGGLGLAAVSLRLIKSELYGVKAYDPLTFAAVLGLLVLAAALSVFAPTLRIARIDPASTLRAE